MTAATSALTSARPAAAPPDSSVPRVAPPGFTPEQWATFVRDGFLVIENAIPPDDVKRYLAAIERVAAADGKTHTSEFYSPQNVVERDPVFAELIDHPRHIGFAYDLYGEQTKLQQSQFMMRPKGGWHNLWHPDGPRGLPYNVFSPDLPLQLKIGYWLTDLPRPKMGNFVCLPGSHHDQYADHYDTHDSIPGEHVLTCKAGTVTLLHNACWHRVEPNESDVVRRNIFYTYSPSWVCNQDRWHSNPEWLAQQTRERRILMRSYKDAYHWAKPNKSEFPLYLDRDTGGDRDAGRYKDHVELHRRKRLTWVEKRGG